MHDIKWIRDNEEAFDQGMARRGLAPCAASLIELDGKRRSLLTVMQALQAERNETSKNIGAAMKAGDKAGAEALKKEVSELKIRLSEVELEASNLNGKLEAELLSLPSIPFKDVPDGESEDDNIELRRFGQPPVFEFDAKEHFELGEALNGMDFERAAKLSGSRFVMLKGQIARLSRAIGQFMIDIHTTEFGYQEINAPVLVRASALYGTSQLPKFEDDLFKTTGDHYLISTSEVTLSNIHADEILRTEDLPLRYTTLSQCFRSEAGSAGRDTRGMIRQHQFEKVELVSLVAEEEGEAELSRMLGCAEAILQRLGLAYRVMTLCTGDMGFSAARTFDLEVWLPGQGRYREISSCSLCGDFQARRMKLRHRSKGDKKTDLIHTLNGSGLAVGRTLIAVLENYQRSDGTIEIPQALRPYMGGQTMIGAI